MLAGEIYPFILRNPVSASTHLLWSIWGAYLTAIFWRLARGDRLRQHSLAIFGASICILYGASGIYHAVQVEERLLSIFRRLDHSAIYVLIAGTYTPVFAVFLSGRWRVAMLSIMWALAAIGIACKWLVSDPPYPMTVGLYVALGWVGVLPIGHLIRRFGWEAMGLGVAGGLLYTAGGVIDALRWPVVIPGVFGWHEMLHVLDMGGTLAHVAFVFRYVLPLHPAPAVPLIIRQAA